MWNPIKTRRLRNDWRLVSTLKAYINWIDKEGKSTSKDEIFYYLFENGIGDRKIKHDGTDKLSGDNYTAERHRITHPYYLETIRPWLEGRYDPEIPSYESIKAKEFKDALAGKVT